MATVIYAATYYTMQSTELIQNKCQIIIIFAKEKYPQSAQEYVKKNGFYMKAFPLPGDSIRNTHDRASTETKLAATDCKEKSMHLQDQLPLETKLAVTHCKEKSMHLQDRLPLEQMYDVMLPNQNSPHGTSC